MKQHVETVLLNHHYIWENDDNGLNLSLQFYSHIKKFDRQITLCRRLKPGGGGVNAAIFSAAGRALEVATMERAKSLYPGNSVVVPLPSTSPLCSREGVTHVIHVLGPNMNPHRPNCLDGDYVKGCEILRKAYTSLFEGFLSIVRSQEKLPKGCNEAMSLAPSVSPDHSEDVQGNYISTGDKVKRDGRHEYEQSKKCKVAQKEDGADINLSRAANLNADNKKIGVSTSKAWGSWAQALYHMAMHPERHKDDLLEISDDVVVLNDLYPKVHPSDNLPLGALLCILLELN